MNDSSPPTDLPAPVTEVPVDSTQIQSDDDPVVPPGAMLLELIPIPVTDIDRAIAFYHDQVGFHLDVDVNPALGVRIVQLTPPGSACSIVLSEGVPTLEMSAGSLRGLHLVVAEIDSARAELLANGVSVGNVRDVGGGVLYAYFSDPDGNSWCLQHMPWRQTQSS